MHYAEAIRIAPNITAPYAVLAKLYLQEERTDEAIAQYEAVLEKNPDNLPGYMALGTINEKQGDGEKAESYYRKALEINPKFAPAANNLAWHLADRGENIDEALGFARTAKEQLPESPGAMDTLGWICYLNGSYLNAIAELQDSLELEPDNPIINYHMGRA